VAPDLGKASQPDATAASTPSSEVPTAEQESAETQRPTESTESTTRQSDPANETEPSRASNVYRPASIADASGNAASDAPAGLPSAAPSPRFAAGDVRGNNAASPPSTGPAKGQHAPALVYLPHTNRLEETSTAWNDVVHDAPPDETAELEGAGFVAGVFALERLAHACDPATAADKGSTVLQFLSGLRNWIPHR